MQALKFGVAPPKKLGPKHAKLGGDFIQLQTLIWSEYLRNESRYSKSERQVTDSEVYVVRIGADASRCGN